MTAIELYCIRMFVCIFKNQITFALIEEINLDLLYNNESIFIESKPSKRTRQLDGRPKRKDVTI